MFMPLISCMCQNNNFFLHYTVKNTHTCITRSYIPAEDRGSFLIIRISKSKL